MQHRAHGNDQHLKVCQPELSKSYWQEWRDSGLWLTSVRRIVGIFLRWAERRDRAADRVAGIA
jgi:hypothetical protein